MQRPQLVHSPDRISGCRWPTCLSPGRITCGSGQTAKQSMQSLHAERCGAETRTGLQRPSRLEKAPTGQSRPNQPRLITKRANRKTATTTVHAAPGSGLSLYVTSITFSSGSATAINAFFEEGSTKVLGPGESDSVTFSVKKLTATVSYTFFCSFPGHSGIMKGTLRLVN